MTVPIVEVPVEPDIPSPLPPAPQPDKLPLGKLVECNTRAEFQDLLRRGKAAKVPMALWIHTTWCRYCKDMKPHVKKVAESRKDMLILGLTLDKWSQENQNEFIKKYMVRAYPTTHVSYPPYENPKKHKGFLSEKQLKQFLSVGYNISNTTVTPKFSSMQPDTSSIDVVLDSFNERILEFEAEGVNISE